MNRLKQIPPFPPGSSSIIQSGRRRQQRLAGVVIAPEIAPSLFLRHLSIYGFIDTDGWGRWRCGTVRNHFILVKCRFNRADWAAAVVRVLVQFFFKGGFGKG